MALHQYLKLQLVARTCLALGPPSCVASASATALSGTPVTSFTATPPSVAPAADQLFWLGQRGFHSALGLELPSRRGLFADTPLVSSMLPNRKHIVAQFSPHGLMLVPKAIINPPAPGTLPIPSSGIAASPTVAAVQEPTDPQQQAPIMAIGIKTWRRLKMKKHKIRKRRKERRMQVK